MKEPSKVTTFIAGGKLQYGHSSSSTEIWSFLCSEAVWSIISAGSLLLSIGLAQMLALPVCCSTQFHSISIIPELKNPAVLNLKETPISHTQRVFYKMFHEQFSKVPLACSTRRDRKACKSRETKGDGGQVGCVLELSLEQKGNRNRRPGKGPSSLCSTSPTCKNVKTCFVFI